MADVEHQEPPRQTPTSNSLQEVEDAIMVAVMEESLLESQPAQSPPRPPSPPPLATDTSLSTGVPVPNIIEKMPEEVRTREHRRVYWDERLERYEAVVNSSVLPDEEKKDLLHKLAAVREEVERVWSKAVQYSREDIERIVGMREKVLAEMGEKKLEIEV